MDGGWQLEWLVSQITMTASYSLMLLFLCFLFIFGCTGFQLLQVGCLQLWRGLLFLAMHRLLTALASLVAEYGLQSVQASVVVAYSSGVASYGFSCPEACGIFLDQGSNPCPLHRHVDSQALAHQGSPHHCSCTISKNSNTVKEADSF